MAILKNLLVNGSARFLNTLYANDLTVSGTTTFAGLTTSALTVNGNATMSGTLTLTKTQDLSGTANSSPALIVGGAATSAHMEIDANEIHAKASGTTTAPLYINTDGGVVYLSNGSKISASNGTFTTQTLNVNGTTYYFNSSGNINANGITTTNANINKGIFHNAVVEGTLYAVHQEIDHVANLGGVFLVTPTVKCISSGSNKTLTSVTITASSTTRTNSDGESITYNYSLQINDSAFSTASIGGNNWVQYGEVKVSGNINGTVLGTCDGFIQSINTSTHVLTVAIKYNGDQTLATPSDISTIEDLNVMLKTVYDSSQSKHYPVGIWMKSRDANGYSHISLYGGTSVDPTVRIGNLQGCPTINGESPTGWGIFTNNGYFSGMIVSNSGKIGNFTISDALYSTAKAFGTTANNVYIGDDGISLGTTFKVTKAGSLTATSGSIGGWTIGTSDIHSGTHSAWNTASNGLFLGTTKIAGGNGGTWYLNNDGTGKIGRFTFSSGGEFTTTVSSNTAGMGNGTYAFWAGATSANAASAPFRVTYAGAITATSGSIGESVTIGGTAASTILSNITNAAKTATNYVTKIDSAGIFISPENQSPTTTDPGNSLLINGSGMEIYKAGTSVASYGDTTRIGKDDRNRLSLSPTSFKQINDYGKDIVSFDSDGEVISYEAKLQIFSREKSVVIESAPTYNEYTILETYSGNMSTVVSGSTVTVNYEDYTIYGAYFTSCTTNDSDVTISFTSGQRTFGFRTPTITFPANQNYSKTSIVTAQTSSGTLYVRVAMSYDSETKAFSYELAVNQTTSIISSYIVDGWSLLYDASFPAPSFTMGTATAKPGAFSTAIGQDVVAASKNQTVIGKFNEIDIDNKYAFIVGNGSSSGMNTNALTVDWDGNLECNNIGVPEYLGTPVITKTAGNSTCRVVTYSGYGKTRMLILAFDTSAAISSGSNIFTGTVTPTNARPHISAGGIGYIGGTAVVGVINQGGTMLARACGSIASGATIWVYFTYFVA